MFLLIFIHVGTKTQLLRNRIRSICSFSRSESGLLGVWYVCCCNVTAVFDWSVGEWTTIVGSTTRYWW